MHILPPVIITNTRDSGRLEGSGWLPASMKSAVILQPVEPVTSKVSPVRCSVVLENMLIFLALATLPRGYA